MQQIFLDEPVEGRGQEVNTSGAIFDATNTYRYSLWRAWDAAKQQVAFIMLNPSTADATVNDPTIHRCVCFAQAWGYGSVRVVNLFAYRTPSPKILRNAPEPIGKDNDRHLLTAAAQADCVVIAWGNWGTLHQRDRAVIQLLAHRSNLYCLGHNQSGQPRHPLYVRGDAPLISWHT